MLTTPVALVAFNRPELTRRSLQAIRDVQPAHLFLICDGPRSNRPDDASRCAAVRKEFERIDWPCEVSRKFSDINLGCEANVELGLDWVFAEVDQAIVFEDDCLPDPSFFPFVDELLDRYRDDTRIWQIAGNSHGVASSLFQGDSYAFSTWASVWGWATWRDRWQAHRTVFHRDHKQPLVDGDGSLPVRSRPARPQPGTLITRAAHRHFVEASSSSDALTHGWDKHWWVTIMDNGGLSVTPSVNLVENDGFGSDATHSNAPGRRDFQARAMRFPLRHPGEVALNVEVERELELLLNRVGGRSARYARRLVKSPRLRNRIRLLVNSSAARWSARTASRLTRRRAPGG